MRLLLSVQKVTIGVGVGVGAHVSHIVVTICSVVVIQDVEYSVQMMSSGMEVQTVVQVGSVQTELSVQVE